ncbi:hypothetical protein OH76DRAFT_1413398 [Lentinus brumalis]|uniref:Uncharacterized protein n=1 Tax=Lentinus brumalis TaxID=2498619 RepID=A0A371CHH3_9APHY|nr:hypothetical protein OH76DRAFT_1413398 [Polyporus brumalis]
MLLLVPDALSASPARQTAPGASDALWTAYHTTAPAPRASPGTPNPSCSAVLKHNGHHCTISPGRRLDACQQRCKLR